MSIVYLPLLCILDFWHLVAFRLGSKGSVIDVSMPSGFFNFDEEFDHYTNCSDFPFRCNQIAISFKRKAKYYIFPFHLSRNKPLSNIRRYYSVYCYFHLLKKLLLIERNVGTLLGMWGSSAFSTQNLWHEMMCNVWISLDVCAIWRNVTSKIVLSSVRKLTGCNPSG